MDLKGILDRIDAVTEKTGDTDRAVSLRAGLSADAVRNWRRAAREGRDAGANKRTVEALANALGVNPDWLETGVDEVGGDTPIRSVSPQVMNKLRHVVCYDIEAEAGHGALITIERPMFEIGFSPEMLRWISSAPNEALALIRVRGDSMLPTLMDGDWMMVDTTKRNVNFDGMFILRYEDVLRVKRVDRNPATGRYLVKSDNPQYDSFEVDRADLDIVGRVVWIGRRV
jgi:phage repressor protein C with HTH and peptisase S24 domain